MQEGQHGAQQWGDGLRVIRAALHHPTRWALLIALVDGRASAKELADSLGLPATTVRHHLRGLQRDGAVEVVERRTRRNLVEHFYMPVGDLGVDEEEHGQLSDREQKRLTFFILRTVLSEIRASLVSPQGVRFSDDIGARVPLALDEAGWLEAVEIHREAFVKIRALRRDAEERLSGSDVIPIRASSVQFLYPRVT